MATPLRVPSSAWVGHCVGRHAVGGANFIFQDPLVSGLSELTFNDEGPAGIEVDAVNLADTTVVTSFFLEGATRTLTYMPVGTPIPEAGTLALFGLALAGLGFSRRKL